MLFGGKKQQKPVKTQEKKSFYPVVHVADSLKGYQRELVQKEVASLRELGLVGSTFAGVLKEADNFQAKLQDLGMSFSNINETAEQFVQVRGEIAETVAEAQGQVEELGHTSSQVQESYKEMAETFAQLQAAIKEIQQCMGKIVSIADQTNILAIKELAREIKVLAGEVDTGVCDVESSASHLNGSILSSQESLGANLEIVAQTDESFQKISTAAEGAVYVQTEISKVIQQSQQELHGLRQFFDQIKEQYQAVVTHIDRASRLGTTKSAMFEDMDNMIAQLPPLVKDLEA